MTLLEADNKRWLIAQKNGLPEKADLQHAQSIKAQRWILARRHQGAANRVAVDALPMTPPRSCQESWGMPPAASCMAEQPRQKPAAAHITEGPCFTS